jgi:tetratricopeptide (TPR) repeat protein
VLADFWFVADYRQCDRLIAALAADLEIPAEAAPQNTAREWRRQVEWRPLAAEALPAALRDLILARNPIDRALWDSWRDAGFATQEVSPQPLATAPRLAVLADEAARPGFVAAAFWRRYRLVGRIAGIAAADRARDAGDWAHAARRYRKALADMPNAPAVWVQYGHALKQLGELAAAEDAYRRSLALDPDTADTHLQLGRVLELQGRTDEAAASYQQSAALHA